MWQRARYIKGTLAGQLTWVKAEPPTLKSPIAIDRENGSIRVNHNRSYESNCVGKSNNRTIFINEEFIELLPEFAEHVDIEVDAKW